MASELVAFPHRVAALHEKLLRETLPKIHLIDRKLALETGSLMICAVSDGQRPSGTEAKVHESSVLAEHWTGLSIEERLTTPYRAVMMRPGPDFPMPTPIYDDQQEPENMLYVFTIPDMPPALVAENVIVDVDNAWIVANGGRHGEPNELGGIGRVLELGRSAFHLLTSEQPAIVDAVLNTPVDIRALIANASLLNE